MCATFFEAEPQSCRAPSKVVAAFFAHIVCSYTTVGGAVRRDARRSCRRFM
jgi:hypothetical protein